MRKLWTYLVFAMLLPGIANAGDANCYATFYQTKDMACVDEAIAGLSKLSNSSDTSTANNQAMVGYFAELFRDYPEKKMAILKESAVPHLQAVYTEALYRAGLTDEAKSYADAKNLSEQFGHYKSVGMSPLQGIEPENLPGDNDVLIGAYMVSGDTNYVHRILENYGHADDAMVIDALRIAFMQGKFGPTLAAPGRPVVMLMAACEKYQCKKDKRGLMRLMTLGSAFWALHSLGQNDDGIKKTFEAFFKDDKRLAKLFALEQNAFGNYLTMLAAYAGIKDNPKINASLSIYEHMGAADEATRAMFDKKN